MFAVIFNKLHAFRKIVMRSCENDDGGGNDAVAIPCSLSLPVFIDDQKKENAPRISCTADEEIYDIERKDVNNADADPAAQITD